MSRPKPPIPGTPPRKRPTTLTEQQVLRVFAKIESFVKGILGSTLSKGILAEVSTFYRRHAIKRAPPGEDLGSMMDHTGSDDDVYKFVDGWIDELIHGAKKLNLRVEDKLPASRHAQAGTDSPDVRILVNFQLVMDLYRAETFGPAQFHVQTFYAAVIISHEVVHILFRDMVAAFPRTNLGLLRTSSCDARTKTKAAWEAPEIWEMRLFGGIPIGRPDNGSINPARKGLISDLYLVRPFDRGSFLVDGDLLQAVVRSQPQIRMEEHLPFNPLPHGVDFYRADLADDPAVKLLKYYEDKPGLAIRRPRLESSLVRDAFLEDIPPVVDWSQGCYVHRGPSCKELKSPSFLELPAGQSDDALDDAVGSDANGGSSQKGKDRAGSMNKGGISNGNPSKRNWSDGIFSI